MDWIKFGTLSMVGPRKNVKVVMIVLIKVILIVVGMMFLIDTVAVAVGVAL